MTKNLVPQSKVGTPFQSPGWRYQAVYNPDRFGFGWLRSKKEVDAAYLQRLITKGIRPSTVYTMPSYFKELSLTLPKDLADLLIKIWDKHYFSQHRRKMTFNSTTSNSIPVSWNIKLVEKYLNDDFLVRLIKHTGNVVYDPYIDEAVKFYKDPSNVMNCKWVNYCLYGGKSDKEIAQQWDKPLGVAQALRLMFFDYSHWPKDRIAQLSMMRQLVVNAEIDDADYHLFRRIYDLGEVGLKSVLGTHTLDKDEAKTVERYLASSTIDNILDLRYTVKTSKDAMNYSRVMSDYKGLKIKQAEVECKNNLIKLTEAKLAKEIGLNEDNSGFPEERELMFMLDAATLTNAHPKFPAFVDIKAEEAKIAIENKE